MTSEQCQHQEQQQLRILSMPDGGTYIALKCSTCGILDREYLEATIVGKRLHIGEYEFEVTGRRRVGIGKREYELRRTDGSV